MSSHRNEERMKSHTAGTWALIYRSFITDGAYYCPFFCFNFLVECEVTYVLVRFLSLISLHSLQSPLIILCLFFVRFLIVLAAIFAALILASISFSWVLVLSTLIFRSKCIILSWWLWYYSVQPFVRCVWYLIGFLVSILGHPCAWSVLMKLRWDSTAHSFVIRNLVNVNPFSPLDIVCFVFGTSSTFYFYNAILFIVSWN